MKTCPTCGGTGIILNDRSWFIQDGYTAKRCRCGSGFTGDAKFNQRQRVKRERVAKWGGLKPQPQMLNERGVCLQEFQ